VSADDERDVPAVPATSILGRFSAAIADEIGESTKVLPVGVIAGFYAQYRALTDDEADAIRSKAKQRAKLRARVGESDDDPEGERQASAVILAQACVQLMVPDPESGGYQPMHEALAGQGVEAPQLRYNRDLIVALAEAGEVPGGLTETSSAVDIVTTLHRRGESTAPLTSMAALYEAWRSGVTEQVLSEAIG
jgi:hypothetical protein